MTREQIVELTEADSKKVGEVRNAVKALCTRLGKSKSRDDYNAMGDELMQFFREYEKNPDKVKRMLADEVSDLNFAYSSAQAAKGKPGQAFQKELKQLQAIKRGLHYVTYKEK